MNTNFQKQLDALISKNPIKLQTPTMFGFKNQGYQSSQSYQGYQGQTTFDSIKQSSMSSNVIYILAAIFVVMVILTAIHFFVKPIFPGWLVGTSTLPGMNDSKLFWATNADFPTSVQSADLPITGIAYEYTTMIDIQIDNPTSRIGASRVMLDRGGVVDPTKEGTYITSNTINTLIPDGFNYVMYFDPDSTDFNISIGTQDKTQSPPTSSFESILIPDFPIQKSVRVTLVINFKTVEVYINGYLYKILTLSASIDTTQFGDVNGPISDIIGTAEAHVLSPFGRVQNLRIWRRALLSSEIRSYGSGAEFPSVQNSDTCVA